MALGTLATVGAALAGASAAGKAVTGASQTAKGKKALKRAVDPGYKIPEEFQRNLGQAEQMSKVGLPSEQYNLASTNIQRGTQAGLRQLSRMSNPFAGIAGLQRGQSDAFAQLDASNAAARRQNILQAMGARRELAGQKLSQQQYAQQGYFDKVNQANAMIGAGRQNVAGALGTIGNVGLGLIGAGGSGSSGASPNPMSPTQMSMLSSYKTPSLTGLNTPTDIYGLGNNSGAMNFGSFSKPSQYSGFGFRKG
jgi:hypothetical protein